MELPSPNYLDVAESTKVQISSEELKLIVGEIEAELHNSEVFRRALAGLQTMLGGTAAANAQILMDAVGREAIRQTLQQFVSKHQLFTVSPHKTNAAKHQQRSPTQNLVREDVAPKNNHTQPINQNKYNPANSKKIAPIAQQNITNSVTKKIPQAQQLLETSNQQREARLRQIGQRIKQARQAKGLTLRQLHNQSFVLPQHIHILETGRIELLPENSYLLEMIRKIGDALELDSAGMVNWLLAPETPPSVVPSWYRSQSAGEFDVRPVHLYLGYAAFMAGAMGGLVSISPQITAENPSEHNLNVSPQSHVSKSPEDADASFKPGLKSTKLGVVVGSDIAPPETLGN